MSIALDAPAKINLYLHITGRRHDGYHLLDSLFLFLDLKDTLYVEPATGLSMTLDGPWHQGHGLESLESNLVLKAARLLKERAGISDGAKFRLEKHIPVAAGLGGGSADAAAALRLCARLWDLDVPIEELQNLALQLGADVPPCLYSQPCYVRGIGDKIEPAGHCPDWGMVLVNPRISMPTADIFRRYKESGTVFRSQLAESGRWTDPDWLEKAHNDLQPVVVGLQPEIQHVIDHIAALPGCRLARMSGSGATCFGIFDDTASARRANDILHSQNADWWTWSGAVASEAEIVYSTC